MSTSPRVKPSCVPCRNSKRRCDHERPCRRCVKYGLQCIPHNRGPGRPSSKRAMPPPPAPTSPPKAPPPPAPYVPPRDLPSKPEPVAPVVPQPPSPVESSLNDRITEIISMTIVSLGRQGRLDGAKLLATLGAPDEGSSQPSYPVCGVPGLNPTLRWALDVSPSDDAYRVQQPVVRALLDDDACYIWLNTRGSEVLEAYANERMGELFLTTPEQHKWVRDTGLPSFYAWGRFLAPEEVSPFYTMLARCIAEAGNVERLDTVVRCTTKDGEWVRCMTSIACELNVQNRSAYLAVRFWPLMTRTVANQAPKRPSWSTAADPVHSGPSTHDLLSSAQPYTHTNIPHKVERPWQDEHSQYWPSRHMQDEDDQPRVKRQALGGTRPLPSERGLTSRQSPSWYAPTREYPPATSPARHFSHPSDLYVKPQVEVSPERRSTYVDYTRPAPLQRQVHSQPPANSPLDSLFKAMEILRSKGEVPPLPSGVNGGRMMGGVGGAQEGSQWPGHAHESGRGSAAPWQTSSLRAIA